jgi:hypothetical protein
MFANCVTILEVGAEGEATTQVESYLENYFEAFGGDLSDDWQTRAQEREPFIRDDKLFFTMVGSQGLSTFIWANYAVRPNQSKLAGILRELGWKPEKASIRNGDDTFKRSLWGKPVGVRS